MGIWLSPPEPPKEWETIFVGFTRQIGPYKACLCRIKRKVRDNGDGSHTIFYADMNGNHLAMIELPPCLGW